MSTFSGFGKSRRNLRPRVVHSVSDSDAEDLDTNASIPNPEKNVPKKPDPEGALSFTDQEVEDDFAEVKLKKPEHSRSQFKKKGGGLKKKRKGSLPIISLTVDKSVSELVHAEGIIPTPAAIHAAKKKRELARNYRDDIGTSTSQRFKNAVPFNPISDDENSDDGVIESQSVRQFGVACDTSKQMQVLSALDNADSGSDEEKFNEEQIFKGVYNFPLPSESTSDVCGASDIHISSIVFTPISVESLQSKLKSQLSYLKGQLSDNNNSTTKLNEDMKAANEEINAMDSHSQALAIKYQFFQETRCHIRDLLLCLTEKVPRIKKLEDSLLNIFKKKSEMLACRRRLDVVDSMDVCSGKDIDHARHSRIVEKEGRRRRRKDMRNKLPKAKNYDGESSDDELLQSEELKFQSEIDEIISQKENIFSDVIDDFSIIFLVMMHFREWKYNFSQSYNQAYISLCLPKLLAPYVSLQLLSWNPLSHNLNFENMPWLKDLLFFEFHADETMNYDTDIYLIPRIIELTVVAKVKDYILQVWDPLSSTQTSCLVKSIQQLGILFPTIYLKQQDMLDAIYRKNCLALEKDIFIPIFSPEVMYNTASRHYVFSQRQFWTAYKLLENLLSWQGMLSTYHIEELVIDGLINRYILLSLQNSPPTEHSIVKIDKILSQLPSEWWTDKHLSNFLRYFKNLISSLQDSLSTEVECNRQGIRMAIDRASMLLAKTNN